MSHVGAPGETRTPNRLIRSQMLYPLSYGRFHPTLVGLNLGRHRRLERALHSAHDSSNPPCRQGRGGHCLRRTNCLIVLVGL